MIDLNKKLLKLKNTAINENMPIDIIQQALSTLLLSSEGIVEMEQISKKLDNDMELIIYTLNSENQLDAALKVIDEAIAFSYSD